MKVLVLGGGGREHALVWKLAREAGVTSVICAPGNPGTSACATNVALDILSPMAVLDSADIDAVYDRLYRWQRALPAIRLGDGRTVHEWKADPRHPEVCWAWTASPSSPGRARGWITGRWRISTNRRIAAGP